MALSHTVKDIYLRDIFRGLDISTLNMPNEIQVPDEAYRRLLDCMMERSYLNNVSDRARFLEEACLPMDIAWLQIMRLPVHPNAMESYDLFTRWQGVLSTLHAWGYRVYFMLLRKDGETHLYLGTASANQDTIAPRAAEQLKDAASASMPGIELRAIDEVERMRGLQGALKEMRALGAVTGIPSFVQNANAHALQTLDQLAFGIQGKRKNYALLVIADPLPDEEINDVVNRMRALGSEIHTYVSRNVSEQKSNGENKEIGLSGYAGMGVGSGIGRLAGMLLGSIIGAPDIGTTIGSTLGLIGGAAAGRDARKNISISFSRAISTQFLDKFAQYAEELTEKHIERLKQGRNLGFWNAGVYVLGDTRETVSTVMGMLRSVYSGDESYVEPIRLHMLRENSGAMEIVKDSHELIPLTNEDIYDIDSGYDPAREWHIFGKRYQYLSTPLNTRELTLATSLPRRDVPGLRFVKTAVRFANNPPIVNGGAIELGGIVDMGVEQNKRYGLDVNALVRHTFVAGASGYGKTSSCKVILDGVLDRDIPVMIIEPAKDDYVRWAIRKNKTLPPDKRFCIYMPGADEMDGVELEQLRLNPFEPAAASGEPLDVLSRCENLASLLVASLPGINDVMPALIDETVYTHAKRFFGEEFERGKIAPRQAYPRLDDMTATAETLLQGLHYAQPVYNNLSAAVRVRLQYLTRGARGALLNVDKSTDYHTLFSRRVVVNLSRIAGAKDKALIMALLMLSMYEYRACVYAVDRAYRRDAQANKLMHLTLVEEAHTLLASPPTVTNDSGNPQQVVADLFSAILAEIRGYGEGMMIVDQIPSKLIPDIIKNTNYKIVHRLTAPDDCQQMAACLGLREDQKSILPALEVRNALICGDEDDAAAWVRVRRIDDQNAFALSGRVRH